MVDFRKRVQKHHPERLQMQKNQKNKNLTFWDDHLDEKYGKTGTPTRDKYEQGFEAFKLGVLIQEARIIMIISGFQNIFLVQNQLTFTLLVQNDDL